MIKENFIRLFENSIKENWDLPAWTDYTEQYTMTYADVGKQVATLHTLFKAIKLEKNAKIALIGKNGCNWCSVYVAAITYGAIVVPILQDFNPNDVQHIVNHSDSQLLFVSDNIWEQLNDNNMPNIRAIFSLSDFRCIYQKDGETVQKENRNLQDTFNKRFPKGYSVADVLYVTKPNNDLASIVYTSGTTGFSKGVMLSGNALAGNIVFGIQTQLIEQKDKILAFLPLAHAYGCAFDFLTAFCAGAHTTFLGKIPSPKVLVKAFSEIKPNSIFLVPLIIEKIYKSTIIPLLQSRSIRLALSIPAVDKTIYLTIRKKINAAFGDNFKEVVIGGAPLNPEVEEFFRKIGFKFTVGYGMTECAPLISYSPHTDFIPFSVGKVLDSMEVKIDSPDPKNVVGEILVRGENVMIGYYKNQGATKDIFTEDGWMHTGDMGTLDENNNIFIRGRSKTMLLSASGQNIYPEEIEAKLNNMPFVGESLVIENQQNKLVALVYPDYNAIDESNISQEELILLMEQNRKELNAMVAAYENVIEIKMYPNEFEKTPKKSIKRYLYTELAK